MVKEFNIIENLKRQLGNLLRDFEKNRQWADFGNWLSRLQPILISNKCKDLPHKIQIAKRLAQCLNQKLPAGIHSSTLSIYNTILNNFGCTNKLLPLFSIGLFPFFYNSNSSSLKIQLIKIFQTHFIKTPDCLQLLTSLMNALLTGLNQNNDELAKKIYSLCDKIAVSYGRMWIDGAVWINILKSPKVRISGFKYFFKTFKERDKLKKENALNQEKQTGKDLKEVKKQTEVVLSIGGYGEPQIDKYSLNSVNDSFTGEENLQDNSDLIFNLMKVRQMEDNQQLRFPNFSTLVVSALCQCLQGSNSDTKKHALDMMIFYLKLSHKDLISEKDGVHLVSVLLQTIKLKENSLTRRVYSYLFGQPNTENQYSIQQEQNHYQLYLLKIALQKMLKNSSEDSKIFEGSLTIIEILLNDHKKLIEYLLPILAYDILTFLFGSNINNKRLTQFYQNVIEPSSEIFSKALQNKIVSEKAVGSVEIAKDVVLTIDYYYTLRNQIEVANKSQIPKKQVLEIVGWLLKYLFKCSCSCEGMTIKILQLCNKLVRLQSVDLKSQLSEQSIKLLDQLIIMKHSNNIYTRLLTLHPHPSKQILLPFMNEISLSIVCITSLLSIKSQQLSQKQKQSIFFSIFKLLNCHLWQDQGIQFIKLYKNKYPQIYEQIIDEVEPSQWLIYWKKMGGDVDGGVIRMIKNLDSDNHLQKQLSKKWLESSKQICSKVIDPIYKLIKGSSVENIKEVEMEKQLNMKEIYKMIQKVFLIQKTDFIAFFFLEKDRYFLPLITKVLQCINNGDEQLKSQSISMLVFLMQRANNIEEKLLFIQTTINKIIYILRKTFGGKGNYQREIQILQAMISMVDLFCAFKGKDKQIGVVKRLVEQAEVYETMSMGMKDTNIPYVRTLYIDFLQKSIQAFAEVTKDNKFMSEIITCVFEKLFLILKENDITSLQHIIKGKQLTHSNRKKKSDVISESQNITQTQFNVQAKYAQVIQLWNSVKFLVNVAIKYKMEQLHISKLLSLILQSFPFSQIKYQQISQTTIEVYYQQLQEQIRDMTGLKKQVLEIFDTLWQNYDNKIINFLIFRGDPRVLIHGSVDPTAVIKQIAKSQYCLKIQKYLRTAKLNLPKNILHYNRQLLTLQNEVCYFLYLYLLYCNLTTKNIKKITNFLQSLLSLIRILKLSQHCQTKLWILQILYCIFERIEFRELNIENGRIKLQFQEIVRQLINELIYVVAKSKNFTYKVEIKMGLFNIFNKDNQKENCLFHFLKIFPPTVHWMSQLYNESVKTKKYEQIVQIEEFIYHFLFNKWENLTEDAFIQYLSVVSIKTLGKLFTRLMTNIYEQDMQKIVSLTRDWLLILFPLYENKQENNQMYLETVAEFLHSLLKTPSLRVEIIKNMRRNIIDIYMGNDFFKCTKNTLNNWKNIIDYCTQNYDLLGELLPREGLFKEIFTTKAESTRLKIKNFQRVCFLIYSGKIDKYETRLRVVLQSLSEVMKSNNPSPALLILILFCIRILVMRLSQKSLNQNFKSFFPNLITLLIQIYTKQSFSTCTNLLLAGLKVIELVHALQLQQFNFHKWLFIFDYFGIRIDSQNKIEQMANHSITTILTPFKFKPMMTRTLPQQKFKCTFIPENWPDQTAQACKRKIIIKEASIQSNEQLRNHTLILLQHMMDLNQRRVTVAKEEIQDLIEADFISLDDYIFQIK